MGSLSIVVALLILYVLLALAILSAFLLRELRTLRHDQMVYLRFKSAYDPYNVGSLVKVVTSDERVGMEALGLLSSLLFRLHIVIARDMKGHAH